MTTFKKRPGQIRTFILLLITMILLDRINDVGIDNNEYNYTRTKFEWEMDQYSQYSSIVISAIIIGKYSLTIFLPLILLSTDILMSKSDWYYSLELLVLVK